jgi:hypothetical protein
MLKGEHRVHYGASIALSRSNSGLRKFMFITLPEAPER